MSNNNDKKKKNIVMFPEVWDELTKEDFVAMLKLRERLLSGRVGRNGHATIDDIRNEAARELLLNRGIRTRMSDDKYFLLVHQCGLKLDWLWQEDDAHRISLVYRSTVNLLPRWDGLLGPMSHGADLSFGEFKEALALCQMFDKTGEANILRQLSGLLYRRRASSKQRWPRRLAFDRDGADAQLARGQRMPDWFVWGTYAWFSFFCEYLTTGIFIIDGHEVCFAPVFGGTPTKEDGATRSEPEGLGLNAIAMTLAESGVFGDFEDVLHAPLMRVMMKLLHDKNTYDRERKRLQKKS